jgi:hypothetical protein
MKRFIESADRGQSTLFPECHGKPRRFNARSDIRLGMEPEARPETGSIIDLINLTSGPLLNMGDFQSGDQ